VRHKAEKSAEEHYEEAARRNAYSVARCASAYHGCMLETGRAFNAMSIFVFRELSIDVWTGCVKDWPKFIVIGVRDSIGNHAHGREVELEAVGSEGARSLAGRIEAMRHTEDLRRMRNEADERINSGESAFGRNSGRSAFGHGDLSWTGAGSESPTEQL
jgi:hypothetical protein